MSTTVAPGPVARLNQAVGGRPVDPTIDAFDGLMEALCALHDDQHAIGHAVHSLEQMRRCVGRLEQHLAYRVKRLASVAIPEVERAAQSIDMKLTRATRERRVTTGVAR